MTGNKIAECGLAVITSFSLVVVIGGNDIVRVDDYPGIISILGLFWFLITIVAWSLQSLVLRLDDPRPEWLQ